MTYAVSSVFHRMTFKAGLRRSLPGYLGLVVPRRHTQQRCRGPICNSKCHRRTSATDAVENDLRPPPEAASPSPHMFAHNCLLTYRPQVLPLVPRSSGTGMCVIMYVQACELLAIVHYSHRAFLGRSCSVCLQSCFAELLRMSTSGTDMARNEADLCAAGAVC